MQVKSLGYRTDLIFPAFDGEVIDRGDYLVVRSPTNPNFYWGNFLLFSRPPRISDFAVWRDLFAREIGSPPETEHQVFGWDSPEGEAGVIEPFLSAGFSLNKLAVMASRHPRSPVRPADQVAVRALKTAADWELAVENQVRCREPGFEEADYRLFRTRQMDRYRRMAASGRGNWYGAFASGQLVADLGLFHDQGVGRFQTVQTLPAFRRRGIAGTLIFEAGRQAVDEHKLRTLVIVADQDSSPARLYASLGFQQVEKQVGLAWWPGLAPETNDGS